MCLIRIIQKLGLSDIPLNKRFRYRKWQLSTNCYWHKNAINETTGKICIDGYSVVKEELNETLCNVNITASLGNPNIFLNPKAMPLPYIQRLHLATKMNSIIHP